MILFFVWAFFSLPWIIISGLLHSLVHVHGERKAAMSAEQALNYEMDCFLTIFGMPIVFGIVLFLISFLVPNRNKGVGQMGGIFGFSTIVRVFLCLLFGGSLLGWQLAAQNANLAAKSKTFWLGANIGWAIGVPLIVLGFIMLIRALPKGAEGESKAAGFFKTWLGWWFTLRNGYIKARTESQLPAAIVPAVVTPTPVVTPVVTPAPVKPSA